MEYYLVCVKNYSISEIVNYIGEYKYNFMNLI